MSCADCVHLSAARAATRGAGSWRHELALRGIGWMRLSALRSLFDCRGRVYFCAWSRARAGYVARAFPHFVIGGLDPAIHADTRMLDRAFWHAARQHGHRVRPGVDEKRRTAPKAASRERGEGDRSSKPPQFPSPVWRLAMAKPGRKRVAGTTTARRAIAAMQSREQRSRIRPSNKCPASGICMTWGRRQTQNVHRPCLRVYTRTAISRMRRSARVQRGRAIFCSIAAGANYRSVACARSAH